MARACAIDKIILAYNGVEGPDYFQVGAAGIYAGYAVMFDDADEVKVAATNAAKLIGIAGSLSYVDIASDFTVGEWIPVWMIGSGVEVQVTHDGTTGNATLAIEMGDIISRSDTIAGLVEVDAALDLITIGRVTRAITIATGVPANIRIQL